MSRSGYIKDDGDLIVIWSTGAVARESHFRAVMLFSARTWALFLGGDALAGPAFRDELLLFGH
jgi:hypothetical protein